MSHDSTRPWTPRGDRPIERILPRPARARHTTTTTTTTTTMASSLRALARAGRSISVVSRASRAFSTAPSQASIDAFMEKFEAAKTVASMEAPSTTMSFAAAPAVETTTGTPEKLRLNFYVPHDAPHDGEEVRSSRRESSNRIAGSRARSGVHRATRAFASSRTTRTNARGMRTNAGLCIHRLVSHRIASRRIPFIHSD